MTQRKPNYSIVIEKIFKNVRARAVLPARARLFGNKNFAVFAAYVRGNFSFADIYKKWVLQFWQTYGIIELYAALSRAYARIVLRKFMIRDFKI